MIENILFCFGFAQQILAWILAGGKFGLRPSGKDDRGEQAARKILSAKYNTFFLRRFLLCIGACVFAVSAYLQHDYVLFAAQIVLFVILWFRISLSRGYEEREQEQREE